MIDNAAWANILATATDLSVVCEIYSSDAVPGDDGFDPITSISCFAAVSGISLFGVDYKCLVKKFGNVNRKLGPESNTASVEFSNISREISQFEFDNGFEGLIKVIRLVSRSQSTSLDLSQILFTGRCEKPESGDKSSLTVKSNWILGGFSGADVQIPRRKFTKEDQEGRVSADPEFEGFLFIPQYGTTTYSVRVKRGGIAGFFGLHKTVQKTLAYSSYSDLDATRPIPEVFGISQLLGQHIGYDDIGTNIRIRSAVCEGEISHFARARSTNALLPLSGTNYHETFGKIGVLNLIGSSWVAPGNYSRTACIVGQCTNSAVEVIEPAPDIAIVVYGRLVTVPDGSGDWVTTGTFSNNATAHTRFILTSQDYFKLDEAWIEDDDAYESYQFNDEFIIDRSLSDFVFVQEG
jgi:hypothetical protein